MEKDAFTMENMAVTTFTKRSNLISPISGWTDTIVSRCDAMEVQTVTWIMFLAWIQSFKNNQTNSDYRDILQLTRLD